ncbi:MAG: type II restriction endonuclease, partial [Cytophagia bacterium]
ENVVKEKQQTLYGNAFEWRFEFPEVLDENGDFMGFDVVVANPPYGVKSKEKVKNFYAQFYNSSEDIYTIFMQHGLKILSKNADLGLITPITWLTGENYLKIRENISTNFVLKKAITLPYNIFKNAYIDTGIYFYQNPIINSNYNIDTFSFPHRFKPTLKDFDNLNFEKKSLNQWKLNKGLKLIFNDLAVTLQSKEGSGFIKLFEITKSIRGILANKQDYSDVKIDNTYKLFFDGDLNRYTLLFKKYKFVKYHNGLLEKPKDFAFFTGKRLLVRRIISRKFRVMASLANEEFVNKKDLYIYKITNENFDLKFILAILNSNLISFSLTKSSNSAQKNDFTQITLTELRNLPIPNIPLKAQKPFVKLVDKILIAKETDPKADTQIWE